MIPSDKFAAERAENIARLRTAPGPENLGLDFVSTTGTYNYYYNFTWIGRPIIPLPQDIVALQELIWKIKPGAVVETGGPHDGSLIFSASMLALLGGDRRVIGIDIDIRPHNRAAIESHPMADRITLVQGSSVDREVAAKVTAAVAGRSPVIVILDSDQTHDHVLTELNLYAPLVGKGSYLVVMNTAIENMPVGSIPDRPWDKGNNPKTAVHEFLKSNTRFRIDKDLEAKLLITVAPDGHLECVED